MSFMIRCGDSSRFSSPATAGSDRESSRICSQWIQANECFGGGVYPVAVRADAAESPNRRGTRWRRVRLATGVLLVLGVFTYYLAFPWVARRIIVSKLHDAGID